jgi:hypothetical protein
MDPSAATPPNESVFINCPYDEGFVPMLQAIVLGTVCCGFTPRSAVESGCSYAMRLDRILDALSCSHYSIHDLSRCKGEGVLGLARFNMPLELGMAIARYHWAPADHPDLLVMVPDDQDQDYARFISDLRGIDPRKHNGNPALVLKRVMAWLAQKTSRAVPEPPKVEAQLRSFADTWSSSVEAWGELRWWTIVDEARKLAAAL